MKNGRLTPFSKSFRINPSSILLSFSILRTSGAISSFANLLTKKFYINYFVHNFYKIIFYT